MIELLLTLKARHRMGVLYVTHNLDEVVSLADRVAVMQRGRLCQMVDKPRLSSLSRAELLAWYAQAK